MMDLSMLLRMCKIKRDAATTPAPDVQPLRRSIIRSLKM